MLMEMLKESKSFQEKTLEQQEVLAALARSFEVTSQRSIPYPR
jgi:hypothetical protein